MNGICALVSSARSDGSGVHVISVLATYSCSIAHTSTVLESSPIRAIIRQVISALMTLVSSMVGRIDGRSVAYR